MTPYDGPLGRHHARKRAEREGRASPGQERIASRYVEITLEEMDDFLIDAQGFDRVDQQERREMHKQQGIPFVEAGEHIYEMDMNQKYAPGCRVRVYSSIAILGEKGRRRGSDAIRVVLVDSRGQLWGKPFKRIHRVRNWRGNLLKRYEDVLENPHKYRKKEMKKK